MQCRRSLREPDVFRSVGTGPVPSPASAMHHAMMGAGLHVQCTMAGMIKGSGQQAKAVWIVLPSYWVVGVPVALLLGLKTSLGVSPPPLLPTAQCLACLTQSRCIHSSSLTALHCANGEQEHLGCLCCLRTAHLLLFRTAKHIYMMHACWCHPAYAAG